MTTFRHGALALAAASMMWSSTALADSHNCHNGPFSGLYIGASAGYASLDAEMHPTGEPKLSGDDGALAIGGHAGFNLQCGRLVLGIEGDLNYVDLAVNTEQPDPAYFQSSIDWYATLRGRIGLAIHDSMMIYGTAGIAWADVSHRLSTPVSPGGPFEQTNSDTAHGWVIGAGVEFLRHERWLIRAEVLHVDLGDVNHEYVVANTGCGGVCRTDVTWDDSFWTARIGVSIKLGHREPEYEPLK